MLKEIKIRMAELGVTQTELGNRLGWPQSTVARYLTGSVEPSATKLQQMVEALDGELIIKWKKGRRKPN
jgi:predicted transcriptional regulator